MTTTAGSSAEIDAYLAAVRAALSDIPEDERVPKIVTPPLTP
jgi:hypothetical protein